MLIEGKIPTRGVSIPFSSIAFFENKLFAHDTYQIGYHRKKIYKI
jgi:hypothetical protein